MSAPRLAIATTGLTKSLGGACVVDDVALAVPAGSVYGFLGPNGAGKTTTMRLLLGLMRPDAGDVQLLGHAMPGDARAALARIGAFIETPGLYDHLSGRTNLDLTRRLRDLPASEIDRVLDLVDLTDAAKRRAGTYSLGMKQRLALARALLGRPELLLLDEPTNGLDPDGIIAMRDLIRTLPQASGCTVFVSSHLLSEVEQMATHMGMMRRGRLVLQGEVRTLIGTAQTVRIALGDAVRGAALLNAAGLDATIDGDALVLAGDPDAMRAVIAAALRHLVGAGIEVFGAVPETRSLEGLYRDTVAREEAA
ncbi:ATP-binding cassette domain-containing protein [Sphingomonas sp. Leaf33]|uniref:ATP-binding cassette domain-containing protein n=1 Tax=Sphingomonas sp. Leaf33 TaxID=1736215 RepID=UPI000B1B372F|nr:ATP-binding cassette domain-containing protein [Sphingomonas sp. Leaf33]